MMIVPVRFLETTFSASLPMAVFARSESAALFFGKARSAFRVTVGLSVLVATGFVGDLVGLGFLVGLFWDAECVGLPGLALASGLPVSSPRPSHQAPPAIAPTSRTTSGTTT